MPELPEVETVRRIVEPQIAGQAIVSVVVKNAQVVAYPEKSLFEKQLVSQKIEGMERRGKFLTIRFESGDRLTLHLRMTGQLLVTPADFPLEKHTHIVAKMSGGMQIRYIDVRRFGRFWLLSKNDADSLTGIDKLGLEPFDNKLTEAFLQSKLVARKVAIKAALLDQSVVAGIGNIYSDEILHDAKIYPEIRCCDLRNADWGRLTKSIKKIMAWGIESNSITAQQYLEGKEYRNTPLLKIYGREGKPCKLCATIIKRLVIGGRSSCYCPHCQKEKRADLFCGKSSSV